MRMHVSSLALIFSFVCFSSSAQDNVFSGEPVQLRDAILDNAFKEYHIYDLDVQPIYDYVGRSPNSAFELQLGNEYNWKLNLVYNDLRSPDYREMTRTGEGLVILPRRRNITYKGMLEGPGGGEVRATIADYFFMASVKYRGKHYFIEPVAQLLQGGDSDLYIVYEQSDVIPGSDIECGTQQMEAYRPDPEALSDMYPTRDHECLEVETAIAADTTMFNRYGSAAVVSDRIITITNLVDPLYSQFDLDFVIVDMFIATTVQPWPTSFDTDVQFPDIINWGLANFVPHDAGQLWTALDIAGCDGSTADGVPTNFGLGGCASAFFSICGPNDFTIQNGSTVAERYNICEDINRTFQGLAVLSAHEFGHTFGGFHSNSTPTTIMASNAPSAATTFNGDNFDQMNPFVHALGDPDDIGCLDQCGTLCNAEILQVTPFPASCPAETDGSVEVFVNADAELPVSYYLIGPAPSTDTVASQETGFHATFTGLAPGDYSVIAGPFMGTCQDMAGPVTVGSDGLDTEPPVAVCQDIFVVVGPMCTATIDTNDVDGGSTDNCGIVLREISRGGAFGGTVSFTIADLADPFVPVTLRVTDADGNSAQCVATVSVLDVDDPMVVCQDDITVNTEDGACYGVVPDVIPPADVNDNCAPVVNLDQIPEPGLLFGSMGGDSIEVFVIATDIDGNMDTCSLFVYLEDDEAPEWLNCPRPDIEVKAQQGMCAAFVNFSLPIAVDNCDSVTVVQVDETGLTSGDMFPVGLTILKWVAFDGSDNQVLDTCRIKIFVNDQQAPMLVCPDDVTVMNDLGDCSAVVNGISATTSDNCMSAVTFKVENPELGDGILFAGADDASGTEFGCGESTVTYRVVDRPLLLISEVTHELEALNGGTDPVPGFIQTVNGDDFVEVTNYGPATMDISCLTVERIGGNNEVFVVPDGVVLGVGDVLTIHYGDGTDDFANRFFNVSGAADLAQGAAAGYVISVDTVAIDVAAVNGADPVGAATMSTVLPGDWSGMIDMTEGGGVYRKWAWDDNSAADYALADLCAPATIGTLNPGTDLLADNGEMTALQSLLPLVVECSFTVTVNDTELPQCGEFEDHQYPGTGGAITSGVLFETSIHVGEVYEVGDVNLVNVSGTHADVSELTFKLSSPEGTTVILFEDLCAGTADFDFTLDSDSTETIDNAPCAPLGGGGIYAPLSDLVVFNGEMAFGTWTLTIADGTAGNDGVLNDDWILQIQERLPYSQTDTVIPNDPGECSALFTWDHPRLFDNCNEGDIVVEYTTNDDIDVPTGGPVEGGAEVTEEFEVGTTLVTYTLTDKAGNTNQCSFTVTVEDVEDPVVVCPNDQIFHLDPGACDLTWSWFPLSATDNCAVVDTQFFVENDEQPFIELDEGRYTFPIGTTVVTIVITDPAGNEDVCTFTVTILEFIPATDEMTCNNLIQLSLDQTCMAEVTADMILEGDNYRCYDNYCIEVTDSDGNIIPDNILLQEHIGQVFNVSVIDCLGSGNSCWGQISLEDKLQPEVLCPEDIMVSCNLATDTSITGVPVLLSCELSVTMEYEDEVVDNGNCGVPRVVITRGWTITDESGNSTTCSQVITVMPFDLDEVMFPDDVLDLQCYDVLQNPDLTEPAYTGIPTLNDLPISGDHFCDGYLGYWDEILYDINCSTNYEILRHWIVHDECAPIDDDNPRRHIQIIRVEDNTPPVLNAYAQANDLYPGQGNCMGEIEIGAIPVDACSQTVSVSWTLYLEANGASQILMEGVLPQDNSAVVPLDASYRVVFYGEDACFNSYTTTVNVDLMDNTPPVPLCDEHTIVSLTHDDPLHEGLTKIPANTFDDGSYDNCSAVTFLARRMSSCIDFDWIGPPPQYGEYPNSDGIVTSLDRGQTPQYLVPFACCDVGAGPIMVELSVTDANGNVNTCMVEVEVQDKLSPFLEAPPDIVVSCDFWFDVAATNGFVDPGEDVTTPIFGDVLDAYEFEPSDRQPVILNDPGNDELPQPHQWGYDGWADDNCDVTITVRVRLFDDCSGEDLPGSPPSPYAVRLVERTWRARDGQDNSTTRVQRIWVVDFDPFYISDETCVNSDPNDGVIWPCDEEYTTCPEELPVNYPTIFDDNCSLIGVTYEDTRFDFVDGACYKILREWSVIDWCQYDGNTGAGSWSHVQVIKVLDGDGADFTDCPAGPVELCVEDDNVYLPNNNQVFLGEGDPNSSSCSAHVTMERTVHETCSDVVIYDVKLYPNAGSEFIQVQSKTEVALDSNNDATLTFSSEFATLPSNHPIRRYGIPYNSPVCSNWPAAGGSKDYHRILWTVEDGCGNISTCEYLFRLEDCKKPSPVCVGLSSVVMPSSGEVTIWAADFNASSFDDCTPAADLLYSFSGTTYEPSMTFDCAAIEANGSPSFIVEIWAADGGNDQDCDGFRQPLGIEWEERNKDFCTTFIVIDDNENYCGPGGSTGGVIETEELESVEQVTVNLVDESGLMMQTYTTGEDGVYVFINPLLTYTIEPGRNDDHKNGVSTLDLIKVQKHLLGMELLGSPYKLIAADANNSQSVSAIDLVEIRKLILGIYQEYPNNQSWRFVDAGYVFPDESSPWPFDELIELESGMTMEEDFVAVKIGDVNGSVTANATLIETRNTTGALGLVTRDQVVNAGSQVTVPITAQNFDQILGYQFTLQTEGLELSSIEPGVLPVTESNFGVHSNAVTTSWHSSNAVSTGADDVLFTLTFTAAQSGRLSEMLSIGSRITPAEAYAESQESGEVIQDVTIAFVDDALTPDGSDTYALFQNEPNPFETATVIGFMLPEAMTATLTIYDITGKTLQVIESKYNAGYNTVELSFRAGAASRGMLYYRLDAGDFSATKKMIVLD